MILEYKKSRLGCMLLCLWLIGMPACAEERSDLAPDRIEIAYVAPTNPAHQPIYETVKERRVLEELKEYLSPLRLPAVLLMKIEGCDGESNAWYEESEHAVTVCYEYLAEIKSYAPEDKTAAGVTRQEAVVGPTVEVFLHEIGHAVFDMLKVPILGREEDAADQIASYMLLQLGSEQARSTVAGVAYMYGREKDAQHPGMKQFADVHGLPAQRFYNLLCLAYGADPDLFGDVVEKGYLPKSRAEGCAAEYKQVDYAMKRLVTPYIDQGLKNDATRKKFLRPRTPA